MKKNILIILSLFSSLILLLFLIFYYSGIIEFSSKEDKLGKKSPNINDLKTLPYLSWAPIEKNNENKRGVAYYDTKLSYPGINIYCSMTKKKAYLIDMNGNIIHIWSPSINKTIEWHDIEMDKKGNLFVILWEEMLLKLDWDSNIKWTIKAPFHHVIAISENGDIYSLTKEIIKIPYVSQLIPIINHYLVIISPDGKIREKISVYDLVKNKIPETDYDNIIRAINKTGGHIEIRHDTPFDILHSNSVEVINRDISGLCKKGDVLISIRELNLVAIVDMKKEKVIWSWGENDLDKQHNPTLLNNGNILIFDNGMKRKYSRIIELNPLTKKIVWEYKGSPPNSFFSYNRGVNQKLPNGNILITESAKGHVFEITRGGKIVWEFYNPDIDVKESKREAIYRMLRIDSSQISQLNIKPSINQPQAASAMSSSSQLP